MRINPDRIRQLRGARHWSQEQLADACGVNLRTIQRLEASGKASMESVRALAAVFEVSVEELAASAHGATHTVAFDAVKSGFLRFADFSGNADRTEYWWLFAFVLLLAASTTIFSEKLGTLVILLCLLPLLAAGSRRLHDTGQSGWWQLMLLAPFGFVPVFIMLALPRKTEPDAEQERAS